jgi:hypothetical protein
VQNRPWVENRVMNEPLTTQDHLNKLTEFRQEIYGHGLTARADTQFELMDALLLKGRLASFPWLATAGCFRRRWPSLYDAVEAGAQDTDWLRQYLARQVPGAGIHYYALDGSAWGRLAGRTLPGRQYVYQPGRNLKGRPVVAGYAYSLLNWTPVAHQSWSLSVDIERVSGQETDLSVGVAQVKRLCQTRAAMQEGVDIIAADCKYSSPHFLRAVRGERCGVVVRARQDRVLRRPPGPKPAHQRGRTCRHGTRFAFKDETTWGEPDEFICLEDDYWGQVELRRWNTLHGQRSADVVVDVLQARVHLEREKPPSPLWLFWLPPPVIPAPLNVTTETAWRGYDHRWPIEPGIRFRKHDLGWTLPQFHTPEAGDRWTILVSLGNWNLYLARPIAQDNPLPWQPRQTTLTPARVRQSWADIFLQIGTPTRPPQTRGKSPGWPKNKVRSCRQRYPVVKKAAKTPQPDLVSV